MPKFKLAILGSTRGTAMQAIVEAINNKELDSRIELVISNKADALILKRAEAEHLKAVLISENGQKNFEKSLTLLLEKHHIDVLILIGYMRILSPEFVRQWAFKIINVHPSLLPHFAGLRDLEVHQAVLKNRHQTTGCTVHYVSEQVDQGPVLIRKSCGVEKYDTKESLKAKVQALEGRALIEAISYLKA